MQRVIGEVKLEAMGIEVEHITFYDKGNNHGSVNAMNRGLFDGYLLEGVDIYEAEKERLQKLADENKSINAKLIVIK